MVPRLTAFLAFKRDSAESQRPPPPYEESIQPTPVLFAEHITTEVVTTTTTRTTHFFVPHWRKSSTSSARATSVAIAQPQAASSSTSMPLRHAPLFVEKDLPPTPTDTHGSPSPSTSRRDSLQEIAKETMLPSLFPSSPLTFPTRPHAALGISLPHGLGEKSPAPSSSQVNTVAFTTPNGSPLPRRVKSSQKLRALSGVDADTGEGRQSDEPRRARGLSMGPTTFLNFNNDTKGKAKAADVEIESPQRSLTRRTSFWTRKKCSSELTPPRQPQQQQPSTSSTLLFTPLPSVQPGSPFVVDLDPSHSRSTPPPLPPQRNHARGLSRSHSERAKASHRVEAPPTLSPPPPPRRLNRPVTADPPSTSNPRSLFLDAPSSQPRRPSTQESSLSPQNRPRANTNPPLLHRLSLSIFSSSASSLQPHTLLDQQNSPAGSPVISQRNSPRPSLSKPTTIPPKPRDDETPEDYLLRLRASVSKADIAGVLATSSDTFYVRALRAYLHGFDFRTDPLDVSLRRLLMDVGLPRETQQIDRVMEAFAARYVTCHPTLFASEDHPYVIAFSLIMLHTDAFNKSNKRKMTKADYVKNTRLPGVPPEVLDCFYDNIVFAPFIFVEDPLDGNGGPSNASSPSAPGSSIFGRGNKVDLYYLISNNLLGPLRVDVENYIPTSNPYSWQGTTGKWDDDELQQAFARAAVIPISSEGTRTSAPFFSMGFPHAGYPSLAGLPESTPSGGELWTLRATKIGMLSRKDEVGIGGKKAGTRKWKPFNVILTGSHILFSRDTTWAQAQASPSRPSSGDKQSLALHSSFRFDEIMTVKDIVAVSDSSYTKHPYTFRLVTGDGRQFLLQAPDENEADGWISRINYASAFKSAGVRMRPLGMSGKDVELTGVAAATSHLHDLQHANQSTPQVRKWGSKASLELMGMLSGDSEPSDTRPFMIRKISVVDDNVPMAPEVEGADQFKATFDQVKADLAAGRWRGDDLTVAIDFDTQLSSLTDSASSASLSESSLPSRSHIVQARIHDLDAKVSLTQSQLDADLRFIRNIAILTPFQRQTHDRLVASVQNISKRIMQERLDIVKLSCHRTVLARDLSAEGRDWNRTKQIALKAATETLQSQLPRDTSIPKMTISFHDESNQPSSPLTLKTPASPSRPESTKSHRPESTTDSFHSALDFDPDIGNFETSPMLDSDVFDSPAALPEAASSTSFPFPDVDGPTESTSKSEGPSPRTSDDFQTHEKFYTAHEVPEEQAEEWNKTRCAQRVSLVRLPSTIGIRFARETGHLV
ncbi:hypothetical protein BDZ89DRAFT_1058971 [Hymenopellis radicata]|nr:hypothetical protein BDZ89DRAFT_1058971 [Hymenopellis radicata]